MTDLSKEQKEVLRRSIVETARGLLGIPYEFGAEWEDFNLLPSALDCSELVEGVYSLVGLRIPDGSQNQFDHSLPTASCLPGDLAFFGRGGMPSQIYHVGLVYDKDNIIEARAFDPSASFETGKVILRPLEKWVRYKNFVGFRAHPKLL